MLRQFLVCLLLVAFVSGQTPQTAPPASPSGAQTPAAMPQKSGDSQPAEVKVGPDDTVITIKNFCLDSSLQGDACKTTITKAQFEKLADALQPGMSPMMRRQLATAYSRMLTMSTAGEKRGLDKTAHFEEAMRFARMQILSQELSKALQAESNNVSDQDIQDYYQKNTANFEQATFARIFVPHSKRAATPAPPKKPGAKADSSAEASKTAAAAPKAKAPSPEEQEKAGEEAMLKEAKAVRAREVKGEDPDKLQKEAYVSGGLPGTPPTTKMEKVRRTSLPASHQAAMDLKPGEVSEVISDPSGNYIYKMISKETLPLDAVKTEIRNQLSSTRYREAMQQYQNNADLNDAYFGAGRGPGMPMQRGGKPQAPPRDVDPD
jgi:PPIC-type PPIASE domain